MQCFVIETVAVTVLHTLELISWLNQTPSRNYKFYWKQCNIKITDIIKGTFYVSKSAVIHISNCRISCGTHTDRTRSQSCQIYIILYRITFWISSSALCPFCWCCCAPIIDNGIVMN
ncbi:unnamed protein product [Acanthoscelides obtectus]|uniref:Uncharacterized protein n=1 Tax=Acanthoscelides obtectus TaxID=200917 RepID=A0A9P0L6L9_ACAOB|nr:unnamed protein product [Acanthoscelides obtectus]CAK1670679.1 hypothetical protein AOBTE_LOCUS27755 [Acanthoscelides obtectus]